MSPNSKNESVLKLITSGYLKSRDFNGVPFSILIKITDIQYEELKNILVQLLKENKVSLVFSSIFENIHIKALTDLPTEKQLEKLQSDSPNDMAVYPSPQTLKQIIPEEKFAGRPFTRRLLLGEPQLHPVFFHFDVLERYLNDPRYNFNFEDNQGSISIAHKYYQSKSVAAKDKIFIQTFGLGYTASPKNRDRVIVVYLRYLSDLSPHHQQIWNTFLVKKKCKVNGDYHRNTMGHWSEYGSIYLAFFEELKHINAMTQLMGKPNLFKNIFDGDRPREFSSFLRPTKKNYHNFVLLLDKMLSDNLRKEFFDSFGLKLKDAEGRDRGTISLLDEWLKTKIFLRDKSIIKHIVEPLKKIRKIRQKPAHSIEENEYSRKYSSTMQDNLIKEAYKALRGIRLLFTNHPRVKDYKEIPDWLYKGLIRIY